jgi:dihydroneopterin aldolase
MSDRIFVEGLLIRAIHGDTPVERTEPQDFLVDISIAFDASVSGVSDKLRDTVDYGQLRDVAKRVFAGAPCNLLEHLASLIAAEVLGDARIVEATITIRKPHRFEDSVPGVSITRRQPFSL